jgi:uncharacterized protein
VTAFLKNIPTWLHQQEDAVSIDILIAPKASRTRIVGEHDNRLKIQLAAPPVDNQANESLVKFLAEVLDIPKAQIEIVGGHAGKRKTVRLLQVPIHKAMIKLIPTGKVLA